MLGVVGMVLVSDVDAVLEVPEGPGGIPPLLYVDVVEVLIVGEVGFGVAVVLDSGGGSLLVVVLGDPNVGPPGSTILRVLTEPPPVMVAILEVHVSGCLFALQFINDRSHSRRCLSYVVMH